MATTPTAMPALVLGRMGLLWGNGPKGPGKPVKFPGPPKGGVALKRERTLLLIRNCYLRILAERSPVKCMQHAIGNEKVDLKNFCLIHEDLPSLDSDIDITSLKRLQHHPILQICTV